ncbi:MAG TPA: lipoyl(octanoyl) transferase LipB [Thermoanaerobaculia bacterium]|nr:lipoyl(octanoyl) transferase LipB [Thermoanaerobaculia bacterium]
MNPPRPLRAGFLGRVPYREAFDLQLTLRDALKRGDGPEHLLLLEHPHVYTLGRNATETDLLAAPEWLKAKGVVIEQTDRGGQITYHGPGQLVGYPIMNLSPDRRDIRRYVRDLAEVIVATLADYGLEARAGEEQALIGVWVGESKVASIGVHLSRWLTTHGFALNVATDLSFFAGIVPCGLQGVRMASIASLTGQSPAVPEVADRLARHFARRFERELAPLSPNHPR